jgi:hypothetical protein
LRYAGQSIDEQLDRLPDDIAIYIFSTGIFIVGAFLQRLQTFSTVPINPWLMTVTALGMFVYAAIRIWKIRQTATSLKLGRDGEEIMAETLDSLKQEGAIVLHDIVGDGFNLDHVVCSRRGIFAVETKTRTKPARGNPTVVYDGNKVLVEGVEPDRNPVEQVTALAKWLEQTLLASTGKRFAVRPVIVFPG